MAVIYIAGPMTGYKDHNRTAFFTEAMRLAADGHVVLNPATLPEGLSQQQYMSICIPMLMCADAIYLLECWVDSAGALAEYVMALKLNMPVSFPENRAAGENRRAAASQIKSHTGD
ncbi:phage protein [Escherichia coli]|uniref:Phage protein n=1 Tax=Escherichia coli TaxID=562 RepID=A0A377CYQ6_ECOLX|nr:phage protein [Escherichia coli]